MVDNIPLYLHRRYMGDDALGEFEQIVLLAILRLENEAYGVPIRQEIIDCTGRSPSPGALYTVLERLQAKGMVASQMGGATAERGGKPKRYYNVTAKGVASVTRSQRAYHRLLKGLSISKLANA